MTEYREELSTILIVDDVPENLSILTNLLKTEYRCLVAASGEAALSLVAKDAPDLVLLDVVMPGIDGFEVCRRLKSDLNTQDIPIIFLTAQSDDQDEQEGLNLGAVDYITKPISPALVLTRIRTHLHLKSTQDFLRDQNAFLEKEVFRRTREVGLIQDVTMVALGSLAETRDNETGTHIRRTQQFMKLLASHARRLRPFQTSLDERTIELLYKSAPLHDIGKVGIPDHILLKPGKLTADEFAVMKTHTTLGRQAILAAEKQLRTSTTFLSLAREITWTHHERWDGTGYPQGLRGEDIPLSGRLMAVADVYDALRSKRIYKPPFSHETSVALILEGKGTQFDPRLVEVFANTAAEWAEIYERFGV